jgi:hypothetical protein
MFMSHEQTVGQRHFENVAGFKYLRTTLTNENLMHEEVKSRLYLQMPTDIQT